MKNENKSFALLILAEFHTNILNAFNGDINKEEAKYLLKKLDSLYEIVRNLEETK